MSTTTPLSKSNKPNRVGKVLGVAAFVVIAALFFFSFTPAADATAPVITLGTTSYGSTTVSYSWSTDVPAITSVQWKLKTAAVWGPLVEVDGGIYQQDHAYTITGLTPNTEYVVRVVAVSADDPPETTTGPEWPFKTTPVDISNMKIDLNTKTLSWTTNVDSIWNRVHVGVVSGGLNCIVNDAKTTSGNHSVVLNACSNGDPALPLKVSTQYFFEIVVAVNVGGVGTQFGTGQQYFFTGPLTITAGPSTASVYDHGAQFIWTTNLKSSHSIEYGVVSGSYPDTFDSLVANSINHSLTIPSGLDSGTTYYYRVISKTKASITSVPESYDVTSGEASFTTSGIAPGTPLLFNSGPGANATSNQATITFTTNIPTTALVEFNVNPGLSPDPKSSGYTQKCNDPVVCVAPGVPRWDSAVATTTHSIVITGLTTPYRDYYYRVTVRDASGRLLGSGVLKLKTTLSPFDHKFSTGDCSDGTKIGKCNADGLFCRPGGIGPVYDCRPINTDCRYECPQGSTCVDTGDCITDPPPGDALTSCNPKACYMKCSSISGDMAGKRCSFDTDCNGGKCVVGGFVTPAGAGCYKSWSSCDANVILKVRPDRVCNKWYTCRTAYQTTSSSGKLLNQCLDLTICDSLSPNGQCNDVLEGRQCSNDPLRFCKDDTDCIGATATCLPEGTHKTMTYKTPEEVLNIKGFTGYAFVGLDWHAAYMWDKGAIIATPSKIEGRFPLSVAEQIGTKVAVTNGDFEDYGIKLACSKKQTMLCTLNALPSFTDPSSCIDQEDKKTDWGPCVVIRDLQGLLAKYWKTVDLRGSSTSPLITIDSEGSKATLNQMLKITPTDLAGTGAQTTNLMNIQTSASVKYLISVRMKSKNDGQLIQASFVNSSGDETFFPMETLGTAWQTYLMGPINGLGGNDTSIAFKTVNQSNEAIPFWIDDLQILPALLVGDTEKIPESCRLFPNGSSPKCDYTDSASISYRGMKGYCLERDPLNSAICLSWWPVDILAGDNIFGQDASAGYNDRQPLYACMESVGQWNKKLDYILQGAPTSVGGPTSPVMNGPFCDTGTTVHEQQQLYPGIDGASCTQPLGNYRPMTTVMDGWIAGGGDGPCDDVENVGACRENWQPGFCWCNGGGNYARNAYTDPNDIYKMDPAYLKDGGWVVPSPFDQQIHKYEVEYFRVHVLRYNGSQGYDWPDTGDLICNEANGWRCRWGMDNPALATQPNYPRFMQGGFGECLGQEVQLRWDSTDQHLTGVFFYAQRCAASGFDDSDMSGFFATGLFFMKEKCTKLVQVATDTGVSAWTDRTSKTGTYVVPGLNYRYISDMPPVGTVAPPSALLPPDQWTNGSSPAALLGVESADTTKTYPYQIRAGMTYACIGNCSARMCTNATGAKVGAGCFTSDDCTDSGDPPVFGRCIGSGSCAAFDPDLNRYVYQTRDPDGLLPDRKAPEPCTYDYAGGKRCDSNSGKRAGTTCISDTECEYTIGRCINPGASGYCDANSGPKAGFLCGDDAICEQTYSGKCLFAGKACDAGSGAKANAPCSKNSDCSSTAGICSSKQCDAASGPALFNSGSGIGAACTDNADCTKYYFGECTGGVCNSASGPNAGVACISDPSICQNQAKGTCTDVTATVPLGNKCDMNSALAKIGTGCTASSECEKAVVGTCVSAPAGCPEGEFCCDFRDEVCVGGLSSDKGSQSADLTGNPEQLFCESSGAFDGKPCRTKNDCGNFGTRACSGNRKFFGEYQIMRLFAKAFSYWQWNTTDMKYVNANYVCRSAGQTYTGQPCDPSKGNADCNVGGLYPLSTCAAQTLWNPPTRACRACTAGTYVNYACTADASCTGVTGAKCVETQNHPSKNAGALAADANADYCAVKPKVINIVSANQPVLIDEGSVYILKFNASINDEQLPLTQIDIDWGDGNVTSDGPLRIAPREDPKFPHSYTHTYHCSGKGVCNPYYIKVRIKDGWNWCSNGSDKYITTPECSDGKCMCNDDSQACCGVKSGRCDMGTPGKCFGGPRDDLACSRDSDCLAWENGPIIQVLH